MNERVVGRYLLCEEFASGGMASVQLGLLLGDEGFTKTVAIKRLHAQFAKDPEFAAALIDEGRMQARVQHPNVAAALDVVRSGDDLLLVMEYLHAASLAELFRAGRAAGERPSEAVIRAVMVGVLRGLHAAHEALSASGEPLDLVHRDVSPQNILVGVDGVARVVDFGIARAANRSQVTRDGSVKGKPGYMAPEQIMGDPLTRAVDLYAAGVVLWELLTGERLFPGGDFVVVARVVLDARIDPPSAVIPGLPPAIDALVARAVARDPSERFPSAAAFADAIEEVGPIASSAEVAAWVQRAAGAELAERAEMRQRVEREAAAGPLLALQTARSRPLPSTLDTAAAVAAFSVPDGSRPRIWRRGPYPMIAAAALCAAAAGGAALARGSIVPAPATEAHPGAALSVPAPEPSTVAAPVIVAASDPTPAAPDSAPRPAVSTRAPPGPARPVSPGPSRGAAASGPCTTVGADGIKHWNPRCR